MKRVTGLTVITLLLAAWTAFPSALSTAAASMQAGEWKEIQTQNWSWEFVATDVNGDIHWAWPSTDYADNLTWNPTTQEILYLGAGHLCAYSFLRYSVAGNTWVCHNDVPPCMKIGQYDGCFDHGYDIGTVDEARGLFYFRPYGAPLFIFDANNDSWSSRTISSSLCDGRAKAAEFFPALQSIVFVINGYVDLYRIATGAVSRLASGLAMGPYSNVAAYSARHGKLFFGGGNGSSDFYILDTTGKVVKLANAPVTYGISATTFTTDPVTGDILLVKGSSLHVFDPAANVWKTGPDAPFSDLALATPMGDFGVTFFAVPKPNSRTYLYKHSSNSGIGARADRARPKEDPLALTAWPNPFVSSIKITVNKEVENPELRIFDMNGKEVEKIKTKGCGLTGGVHWNASRYAAGIYVARLGNGKQLVTKTIYLMK